MLCTWLGTIFVVDVVVRYHIHLSLTVFSYNSAPETMLCSIHTEFLQVDPGTHSEFYIELGLHRLSNTVPCSNLIVSKVLAIFSPAPTAVCNLKRKKDNGDQDEVFSGSPLA